MQTERSEFQEIKEIREELQALKNRINLLEAELDIREWKHAQAQPVDNKREDNTREMNL